MCNIKSRSSPNCCLKNGKGEIGMKRLQTWMIAAAALFCMGSLTACGTNGNNQNAATENGTT